MREDLHEIFYQRATQNVLAIEVFRPKDSAFPPTNKDTDLAITFVDWAPPPPDNSMGIWREIELSFLPGKVAVRYPSVSTILSDPKGSYLDLIHVLFLLIYPFCIHFCR